MKISFPIVIIDKDFQLNNAGGLSVRMLAEAIEKNGSQVIATASYGDLTSFAQQQSRASAFIVSINDEEFSEPEKAQETINSLVRFIEEIRFRNSAIPIFLYGETHTVRLLPNSILRELHGFIHMFEDTPDFVARYILRETKVYLDSLAPPFFSRLIEYAQDGAYSWHCPGHSGGVAFLKSPVGQIFHQFFGENLLRADVCNAVEELGQLLDHSGPVAKSERNAARIFNCDHLFFVTNGTSTSNKIVWNAAVAAGDVVLVDRNCHKSVIHAIILTGAIPVFLTPTRNKFGIIGPIKREHFQWSYIKELIAKHPLASQANCQTPRILTITQSTYDGILYNVDYIKAQLDGKIKTLLFDEAWLPHAAFHPFYNTMHAVGECTPRCQDSLVIATQSTHKLLAGLSQASQILVQNAHNLELDTDIFNESYMVHCSTSPQYAIIASCDVAAAMMEAPGGPALVQESLREALDFRRGMRKVGEEIAEDWWFTIWEPEQLCDEGIGDAHTWQLKAEDSWHGFTDGISNGFNMLDPIKATLLTPGLNIDGQFSESGIPAVIVSKYLAENGIRVEKTGWYTFFIMFTIGITKGRWNTLVTELQQFKVDYDQNQPLWRLIPNFVNQYPQYERVGLRDLCNAIHHLYRKNNVAQMSANMYASDIVPVMRPTDAHAKIAHGEIDKVPIDDLHNRITAVLLTPYPPGIPLLIPGERFNTQIVDYLNFSEAFNAAFPGFEYDIHGLVKDQQNRSCVLCVRQ